MFNIRLLSRIHAGILFVCTFRKLVYLSEIFYDITFGDQIEILYNLNTHNFKLVFKNLIQFHCRKRVICVLGKTKEDIGKYDVFITPSDILHLKE